MSNRSIQAKLFGTYAAVGILTLIACLVSWNSFRTVEKTFANVAQRDISGMTTAFDLAVQANLISNELRELSAASSNAERSELRTRLDKNEAHLAQLAETAKAYMSEENAQRVAEIDGKLLEQIKALDELVSSKIASRQERIQSLARLRTLHLNILESTQFFIDDANDRVFETMELLYDGNTDAVNQLQDDLSILQAALELNAKTNLAAGLIAEAGGETDTTEIEKLSQRFFEATRTIEDGRSLIGQFTVTRGSDFVSKFAALDTQLNEIIRAGDSDNDAFAQRTGELGIIAETARTVNDVEAVAGELTTLINGQVVGRRQAVDEGASEVMSSISRSITTLLILAVATVATVAFIAFYYVGISVTRPLKAMVSAMGSLAEGNLTIEVPARERKDEIGQMSAAVQVFKDNALEIERVKAAQEESERKAAEEKRTAMPALADNFEKSVGQIVEAVSNGASTM